MRCVARRRGGTWIFLRSGECIGVVELVCVISFVCIPRAVMFSLEPLDSVCERDMEVVVVEEVAMELR